MRKLNKVIITSATTGSTHQPWQSPHLPVTVEQVVEDSVAAAEAGASIIHLHAREPDTGKPTCDPAIYEQYLVRIKQRTDAILNLTTGQPELGYTPEQALERRLMAPLMFSPEITSFNMGPLNSAQWTQLDRITKEGIELRDWERAYLEAGRYHTMLNPYTTMERIAKELGEDRGVRFEFECFDIGHLYTLRLIADRGWVKPPFFIQSVLGFAGGLGPDPRHVLHFKETADLLFGDDYIWSLLAASKAQLKLTTMAAIMGGNVRVGMEDSLWIGKGKLAHSSADQVRRIRSILETLDMEIATPAEAREWLQTKGADRVNF
ncbi:3-keto-5-aminohexanoate cleavage protein [Erythrobacter sp. NE805]|uniref:3-keto-5-aminohexanoate cleavage protein n=1 Tax=Erythrobacter sp. NE805 TaxID=3389875 RepID=UPI00396B0484